MRRCIPLSCIGNVEVMRASPGGLAQRAGVNPRSIGVAGAGQEIATGVPAWFTGRGVARLGPSVECRRPKRTAFWLCGSARERRDPARTPFITNTMPLGRRIKQGFES